MSSTSLSSSALPTTTASTVAGVTHIDLNYATAMAKGSGSIFITDGTVQTVIDRATGQPKLRVVGGTFSKEISLDQVSISGTHVMFDATGLPPGAKLNVYMGAGTLTSGGKAAPAITVPEKASFTVPDVVVDPSGLTATMNVENKTLKAGADIEVTITFSKAVADLEFEAFVAEHATITDMSHSSDNRTWTIKLGATDSVESLTNVLRLDMSQVVSADGTRGSGTITSTPYAVDTIVDAYLLPYLGVNDEGPFDDDGVTNDDEQFVWGLVLGNLESDEHIELTINGDVIDKGRIHLFEEGDGVAWYYDPEEEAPTFHEGANTVTARVVKAGGHSSGTVTKTIVIDTNTPDIVSKPTGLVDASQSISISFDEKMYWDGNSESSGEIEIVDSFGNTSWVDMAHSMLSADGKTLTLSAAQHNLATGNTYRIYLPYNLTDLAGNEYEGPTVSFTTAGPYQDKAPPRLIKAYVAGNQELYGKGDILQIRLRYSEKVNLDAGTAATLALELRNGGSAAYTGLSSDGKEMIFSYTVGANEDDDWLELYTPWDLAGHVRDDAGNVMQNAHIVFDGLSNEIGYGVRIDTLVAKPGSPLLHPDSDTGTVGDRITDDTTPHLSGAGAEPGATVTLWDGDTNIGSTHVNGDGTWNITLATPLSAGTHQIRVSQEDDAGNVSERSDALALTIGSGGSTPPSSLGTPVLAAADDTGASNSDGLTSVDQPHLSGTGPASTTLTLIHNGADIGTVTTGTDGTWNWSPASALADGVHNFSVRQGSGTASASLSVTVDKARPMVASSPDGAMHLNPDGALVIVFNEAVRIPAGEGDAGKLILRDEDDNLIRIEIGSANLSGDKRTLTIPASAHHMLAETEYHVTLPTTLTDLAGNSMAEYEIEFRTGNALLPTATRAIVNGDHSFRAGETIVFRIRFNETIEKVGSTELSLGLSNGERAAFTGISGNEASFSYTVVPGHDMEHVQINDTSTLVGHIADLSGNLLDSAHIVFSGLYNSDGYGSWIDIDTVAPTAPGLPALAADSNSGSTADQLTNDRTPTLTGNGAEPEGRVELYKGDTLLGYGWADEHGVWEVTVDGANALAEGSHALTVKQVDEAGNRSLASSPLTITVDSVANPPHTPVLATGSDSGALGDGLTNVRTPTLNGGGAEANAEIVLFVDRAELARFNADASGNWTYAVPAGKALTDGLHSIEAKQIDAAGNTSGYSDAFDLRIDSTAAAPGRPQLAASSDTGILNNDGITSDTTPTFLGNGAEAGATVVLYAGSTEIGRDTADESGNWEVEVLDASKFTADGNYSVTARQIDKAGNTSAASSAFALVIDTDAPEITSFGATRALREFQLGFDEKIVFRPSGEFKLNGTSPDLLAFRGSSTSNWYTSSGTGGADSVLNFKISMDGLFNLIMNNDAVQDVAGNIAHIIGTPDWSVDLRP